MSFISFSSFELPADPGGDFHCFASELAFATPDNTKALKEYIATITVGGGTNYLPPLKSAMRLLNTSDGAEGDSRKRGI